MFENLRVEFIDAKPGEFHEVHSYITSIADEIDCAAVKLCDEESDTRINIYYYLAEGFITALWLGHQSRTVKFERGSLSSMYAAFDEVKEAVDTIIKVGNID